MEPHDSQTQLVDSSKESSSWVKLCDDFVDLEGQCVLLCELLQAVSRRTIPLEPAGQHGVELLIGQVKQQFAGVKQQLYLQRP